MNISLFKNITRHEPVTTKTIKYDLNSDAKYTVENEFMSITRINGNQLLIKTNNKDFEKIAKMYVSAKYPNATKFKPIDFHEYLYYKNFT
jgi:hypothetical protein